MKVPQWLQQIWAIRITLVIFLTPLLLLPLPICLPGTESACAYTILLMAVYWITEAVPLGVTAFLPLIIFPLSGVMTGDEVSKSYFKDISWLFIGGMMIAISVESTGLHKRIALKVLLLVGVKPRCLMMGFMITTFFLSMWISNTAATALMLPIVEAIFFELKADAERNFAQNRKEKDPLKTGEPQTENPVQIEMSTSFSNNAAYENDEDEKKSIGDESIRSSNGIAEAVEISGEQEEPMDEDERTQRLKMDNLMKGVTLSIPYSASIGGICTITGTGANLVLSGQYDVFFPDADIPLSFANWLIYALPGAIVLLVLAYIWLSLFFFGFDFSEFTTCCGSKEESEGERNARNVVRREYINLGPITWGEVTVAILFTLTALLWFFRDPGFMPGWAIVFREDFPSDGTVAMTMGFLLFVLPGERPNYFKASDDSKIRTPVPAVLNWEIVHRKFPWGIMFLLTGGFALADGAVASGFSEWVGELLSFLDGIEPWAICLVCTIIVCVFTECSSNTATSALFVPILAQLAITLKVHPLYLMLPPVLAASLAFMLPAATPPNAIAFSYGHIQVIDMIKAGWLLNLLGIGVISLFINTYGISLFGLNEFPAWASGTAPGTTVMPTTANATSFF